jgi:hypothetical protein
MSADNNLKEALRDSAVVAEQATEDARSAAANARQETRATLTRMNEKVQLEVAKAVGANVKLSAGE